MKKKKSVSKCFCLDSKRHFFCRRWSQAGKDKTSKMLSYFKMTVRHHDAVKSSTCTTVSALLPSLGPIQWTSMNWNQFILLPSLHRMCAQPLTSTGNCEVDFLRPTCS